MYNILILHIVILIYTDIYWYILITDHGSKAIVRYVGGFTRAINVTVSTHQVLGPTVAYPLYCLTEEHLDDAVEEDGTAYYRWHD